jgi:nucleotide-binding universal stress UspA family protein
MPLIHVEKAERQQRASAERMIDALSGELRDQDVRIRVEAGEPAVTLTQIADEERAALLVVGGPERGPLGTALVGSVCGQLPAKARRPVAVAPRGSAARTASALAPVGMR